MTQQDKIDTLRGALALALKYLEHPEVQEINFVLSAKTAAARARQALAETSRRVPLSETEVVGMVCADCGGPELVTGAIHKSDCPNRPASGTIADGPLMEAPDKDHLAMLGLANEAPHEHPIAEDFRRRGIEMHVSGPLGEGTFPPPLTTTATAPIAIGSTREDEDGWFIVDRRDLDYDVDGYWVSDRWGAEKFIPASRMGDNWKAPL